VRDRTLLGDALLSASKPQHTGWETFGKVAVGALLIVASSVFRGWILTLLWAWFVVPQFHLSQLTIPIAIGLALILGYLTQPNIGTKEPEKTSWAATFLASFIGPIITLGVGWIVHLFVVAS
jgi:hypothetical protein